MASSEPKNNEAENVSKRHNTTDATQKRQKRVRMEMRTTPWKDFWEWERVGQALLSVLSTESMENEGEMSISEALEMISVWKARSMSAGSLAHAVESTASLAQVFWRDKQQQQSAMSCLVPMQMELRLAYSAAIVRCINGFADALQQQRFAAAPVSILCGQLGIPSWLVDIRHEASHNALPSLPVLRLACSTLLEYLQQFYWTPLSASTRCSVSDTTSEASDVQVPLGMDILLQYEASVEERLVNNSTSDETSQVNEGGKTTPAAEAKGSNQQPQPTVETTRPFDTFFGYDRQDDDGSSSDEDTNQWEDPLLGGVWGISVGTSNNRFAALAPPKKTITKKKKVTKSQPKAKKQKPVVTQRKKKPGEKYPLDYAREYVSFMLPNEGYTTALQFLVWGGVGDIPAGMGVLIPQSKSDFPESKKGVMKSWQRHSILIETIGNTWSGFSRALLTHLVHYMLETEDEVVQQGTSDERSRRLYYAAAWIRALLSEQYVRKLCPENQAASDSKKKRTKNALTVLATYEMLESLSYPLNSLCDRCSDNDNDIKLRRTSQEIRKVLEEVLGSRRKPRFGVDPSVFGAQIGMGDVHDDSPGDTVMEESDVAESMEKVVTEAPTTNPETTSNISQEPIPEPSLQQSADADMHHGPKLEGGTMSLDDFEAMLSDDDGDEAPEGNTNEAMLTESGPQENPSETKDAIPEEVQQQPHENPPLPEELPPKPRWARCQTWDACALGTMPGYPV